MWPLWPTCPLPFAIRASQDVQTQHGAASLGSQHLHTSDTLDADELSQILKYSCKTCSPCLASNLWPTPLTVAKIEDERESFQQQVNATAARLYRGQGQLEAARF